MAESSSQGPRVLLVSYDGFPSAFYSQTLGLAGALESAGISTGLLAFGQPKEVMAIRRAGARASIGVGLSGPVRVLPKLPLFGRVSLRIALAQARPFVQSLTEEGLHIVLHCRGPLSAYVGILLRDSCDGNLLRVIADFRGLAAEELALIARPSPNRGLVKSLLSVVFGKRRVRLARAAEVEVCRTADGFACVSQAFRRHLVDTYAIPADLTAVVPTCTSFRHVAGKELARRKQEAKERLGLAQRYVVAYAGSLYPWQEPLDTVEAFLACRKARPDAHFLVLTDSPPAARSHLASAGVPGTLYSIMTVPHDQVQSRLLAADVGLLLRRPSAVNRVASPIKFAEYIASGVPVLASPGIGDLDDLIEAFGVGRIIQRPEDAAAALPALTFDSEGAARLLADHYSWPGAASRLRELYGRVCDREDVVRA